MEKAKKVAADINALTLEEAKEVVRLLTEEYGYKMPVAQAVTVIAGAKEAVVEKKSSFNITLTKVSEVTTEKLSAVKLINKLTNLGLQPSMALTKELPALVMENVPAADAEQFKTELAALNTEVTLS